MTKEKDRKQEVLSTFRVKEYRKPRNESTMISIVVSEGGSEIN